ncbi:sigma-54-dependent Fis family transcriptional regulator [Desulfitobacterium hafniense]|uniref:sigma-54-dependent Fis family transcriptional regulator n=1 Tax=Desulfitobacterium hafniense TaxID=49338 RepID=UPI000366B147|nr:sigma-54-dependent Fis family transcriptional regulator [Desulfitobacterium hafniense]
MLSIDNYLSPIIRNIDSSLRFELDEADIVYIDKVRQLKLDLINNRVKLKDVDIVRLDIAESWLRSFQEYHVDMHDCSKAPALNQKAFSKRISEKEKLLKASDPYIEQLESIAANTNCFIILTDEQGVILRVVEGDFQEAKNTNTQLQLLPGGVWTEETVGTCSHALSILLKCPTQVCGSEHYCESFSHSSCSSAPIFNANGGLEGVLSIASPYIQRQSSHSLGLVVSTAWAIQNEIQLLGKNRLYAIPAQERSPNHSEAQFRFKEILGESAAMLTTIDNAKKFAKIEANILIQGESGTGKEVFAQSIHNESRPRGPFVAENCAAIPRTLIESELFGYEGGSFTGAERQGRIGKIEQANGGTLFLDEIGDMPLELQAVLLRVIEEKKVKRVGGNRSIPVDFRLITATNKDLLELTRNNQFREDLYYRIATFKICIPPLRERGGDILHLAEHYIKLYAQKQKIRVPSLSKAAKYMLLKYDWPGNVRQLQNAVLYAVTMAKNGQIKPEDFPSEITLENTRGDKPQAQPLIIGKVNDCAKDKITSLNELEKVAIERALQQTNNNIRIASELLGMSKSTLYRKIKEYSLFLKN